MLANATSILDLLGELQGQVYRLLYFARAGNDPSIGRHHASMWYVLHLKLGKSIGTICATADKDSTKKVRMDWRRRSDLVLEKCFGLLEVSSIPFRV
jgi:hypothetical protein